MDSIDIFSSFMLTFNTVIFCPILIYFLLQYRKYEKQQNFSDNTTNVIHSRNSLLVYTINILAIITLNTERIYMVSAQIWGIIQVPFWSVAFFLAITWWALMDLFAIKVYNLYYQQQYNQSIADKSWKKDINPHENDWFIRNKNKYGNPAYLIKIAFIPYVISVLIDSLIFTVFFEEELLLDFCHLTLATIPTAIAMYVFWKARHLDDIYNIRNEILYQFIVLLTILSFYMIVFMICHFVVPGADRFEWMTYLFVTDGVTVSLALLSTVYPVYLTKNNKKSGSNSFLRSFITILSDSDEVSPKQEQPQHKIQGINSVISHYECFKAFIEYLVSEFCAENLLFIVELIQIKHAYQVRNNNLVRIPKTCVVSSEFFVPDFVKDDKGEEHEAEQEKPKLQTIHSSLKKKDNTLYQVIDFNVNPNNIDKNKCIYTYLFHDEHILTQICLSSSLPLSAILSENENNLYLQMKMLYNKYVAVNSSHELNLPYGVRHALTKYFESGIDDEVIKAKDYKVFNIMDGCCVEIMRLLTSPLGRFLTTEKFKQVFTQANNDITSKQIMLDSGETPVIRNATSYSLLQQKYSIN